MALGGKRPGAGRPKGARNRATIENKACIEQLARAHTNEALLTLVRVATEGASESARVAAATALLDRGYGKPRQSVEASVDVTNMDGTGIRERAKEEVRSLFGDGADGLGLCSDGGGLPH